MLSRPYRECVVADRFVLVLDNRVLEVFDRGGVSRRWHVLHLGVTARRTRTGLEIVVGARSDEGGLEPTSKPVMIDVPEEESARVEEFFDEVKRARE
ncbi:hypothetical protein HT102_13560 [Hoyosella sp. G463]|uniref:Uncharacterized protein n=1 Tax=Lolliginicoccus lacisalsi TaxID=2742202 RepID=A0A927JER6_9ACTN|nr:hypothetical protein [Lolliginicoccus lacisalsi]MBD8507510.1 hypothetical protein [Lolliginicoccus lacisalsi]